MALPVSGDPEDMVPTWLLFLSWIAIAAAVLCAAWLVFDIYGRDYRPPMAIMGVVWPVTALYFGPIAIWAYLRWGRPKSDRWQREHGREPADPPCWVPAALGTSHCGAGCTLGDIIAEFGVFLLGVKLAGSTLLAEYVGDFVLALLLGVVFQYLAIAPMRGLGFREGIVQAAKADVLSLTSFEIGLFGWMALMSFVFFPEPHLHPDHVTYWFLMQIGMVIGFLTSYPVNVWLIRKGIKERM
ncbi:integral membrane protein [Amycolatopsis mediterranei S699]|nr:integral membrane protein [Amycolatopsis mediterranei S699]